MKSTKWTAIAMAFTLVLFFTVSASAASYSAAQIRQTARSLAKKLAIPADKRADLMMNLDKAMKGDWFRAQTRERPVNGVFVFESGEGGFILGFMEGQGLLSVINNIQAAKIKLKSVSIGAQAGGGASWGVGLVVDLKRLNRFGGNYSGKNQSATAGDSTTYNWTVMRHDADAHDVWMLKTGRGFGAGVAAEKLTITPMW